MTYLLLATEIDMTRAELFASIVILAAVAFACGIVVGVEHARKGLHR